MIIPNINEHNPSVTKYAVALALATNWDKQRQVCVAGSDEIRRSVEAVKEGEKHVALKLTNRDLCYRFLSFHGFHPQHGATLNEGELAPIMPYFIMDAAYTYFCKYILPLPLRHNLKALRARWSDHFASFAQELRQAFSVDEYEQITDLMDEYEKALDHDLFIAHIACMELYPDVVNSDDEKIFAASLMANRLAQIATEVYGAVYKSAWQYKSAKDDRKRNGDLDGCMVCAREFSKLYGRTIGKTVDFVCTDKQVKRLEDSLRIVYKHTLSWLKGQGGEVRQ